MIFKAYTFPVSFFFALTTWRDKYKEKKWSQEHVYELKKNAKDETNSLLTSLPCTNAIDGEKNE